MSETSEASVRITSPQGISNEQARPVWKKKKTLFTKVKTAGKVAAGAATFAGIIAAGSLVEGASEYKPSANEYYTGVAIIDLDKAIARPSAGEYEQVTIDEHTLTVNGQSLQGVERVRVSNPELVELKRIVPDVNNRNTMVNQLMIKVPFDNGVEVYYVYGGPDGIRLKGGDFIKGQEREDGSFLTVSGNTVPAEEMGQVTVLENKPQQ